MVEIPTSEIGESTQDAPIAVVTARVEAQAIELADLKKQVTDATVDSKSATAEMRRELSDNRGLMIFGFVILLAMVAGILLDSWRAKEGSYNALLDKISALETTQQAQLRNETLDALVKRLEQSEKEIEVLRTSQENSMQLGAGE